MAKQVKKLEWWQTPDSCYECSMRALSMADAMSKDAKKEISEAHRILREAKTEIFNAKLKTMNI